MRNLLIAALLFLTNICQATNYYVDTSKSDGNTGTSALQAWKTIGKVNTTSFNPGDHIYFKRDQIWYESLEVPSSGTAGNPIVFSAYGTGADPIIDGGELVTNWTNIGGGIWSADLATYSSGDGSVVTFNDIRTGMGRWPKDTAINNGCVWSEGGTNSYNQFIRSEFKNYNLVNSEIVTRRERWLLEHEFIQTQADSFIQWYTGSYGDIQGAFVQNNLAMCTMLKEWYVDRDSSKIKVFFGADSTPANYTVKVSTRAYCVNTNANDYLLFDGLRFSTANQAAVSIASSKCVFRNCEMYNSYTGVAVPFGNNHDTVSNCIVRDIANNGIYINGVGIVIDSCDVHDISLIPGAGGSYDGQKTAILIDQYVGGVAGLGAGDSTIVTNTTINNIAYIGVRVDGKYTRVEGNTVKLYDQVVDDGAAYYTYNNYFHQPQVGIVIKHNYADGFSTNGGGVGVADGSIALSYGIYLDDNSCGIHADSNLLINNSIAGVFLHTDSNVQVTNNVLYNNNTGILVNWDSKTASVKPNGSITITGNEIVMQTRKQLGLELYDQNTSLKHDSLGYAGVIDYNTYSLPMGQNTQIIKTTWQDTSLNYPVIVQPVVNVHSLEAFKRAYPMYEAHGGIGSVNKPDYKILSYDSGIVSVNTFDSGVDTNGYFVSYVNWEASSPLDAGAAKLRRPDGASTDVFALLYTGVQYQSMYLVKFSSIATMPTYATLAMTGGTGQTGPNPFDTIHHVDILNTRQEDSLLMSGRAASYGEFILTLRDSLAYPMRIDNLSMQPVTVQWYNPADSIVCLHNETPLVQTVSFPHSGKDVLTGELHTGDVELQPYESKVYFIIPGYSSGVKEMVLPKRLIPGYPYTWKFIKGF